MKNNPFVILKGNNGATYIVNTNNWDILSYSLLFYKTRTIKSTILKNGLHSLLFLKGVFGIGKLKSALEINEFLQNSLKTRCDFKVDNNCSVLISPTQDKVIVHHHQQYFQKFAFGKSYTKVKNEADIYKLLNKEIKSFQLSQFFDFQDDSTTFCSFKLSNTALKTTNTQSSDLTHVLVEFFNITKNEKCSINSYINELLDKMELFDKELIKNQIEVLEALKNKYGQLEFPLGLVHRDFKPWNVLNFEKPLLFDFEEAVVDGPPLEDVLNYYIDPIIRYKSPKEVVSIVLHKAYLHSYKKYLNDLNIRVDFTVFIHLYLIERMVFWKNANDTATFKSYLNLSNYLITASKF